MIVGVSNRPSTQQPMGYSPRWDGERLYGKRISATRQHRTRTVRGDGMCGERWLFGCTNRLKCPAVDLGFGTTPQPRSLP
jgi:hypothetical protein